MDNDPIKNPNFIRYLIVFAIGLLILWIVFGTFILPLLPPSLSGGLAAMGYGVVFVAWGLVIVGLYEKKYPDEKGE